MNTEHFDRIVVLAKQLVTDCNLRGPGEPGRIAEFDALRYIVKNLRELRHQIAAGGHVDIEGRILAMVEHLGVTNTAAVREALTAEHAAFSDHHRNAHDALGPHAIFHEDHGWLDARGLPEEENEAGDVVKRLPRSRNLKKSVFEGA